MKSIRGLLFAWAVVLCLCSSVGAYGAGECLILDYRELNQPDELGVSVSESGDYSVWVWARTGSSFQMRIGEREFRREQVGGSQVFSFLWMRLGEVELQEGQPLPVRIEAIEPRDAADTTPIGRLVLSSRPGFHPNTGLELVSLDPVRPIHLMDARLRETRHTRASFDFLRCATTEEWATRRENIRRKILVSAGLWPMPEKPPLGVTVVDTLDRDGYTIEKLYLQTWPGVYMPGTLYRPKRGTAPFPAVINPHGHGRSGRMGDGVQTRCANFALQGYLAFSYNMIGFVDNDLMSHEFRDERAELWSVNLGGLQLWNSIRAVDFITSLPEVDRDRIGCTGASGGGTQTFLLTAVDDRIRATAPVCMVSSIFQGGCLCENPPGLRFDTYNVEIAACAAPRPQILVGATGDWTDLTPDVIYPDVLNVYRLTGDEENVSYYYQDAGHNYNRNSREAVYRWFARSRRRATVSNSAQAPMGASRTSRSVTP